jgi:arylsulfatase A-like enzyme
MPTVMQRIAGEGALFTNAFASLPLCCPSRATFLTGQYAHNHEVWKNVTPLGGMPKFNDTSSLATWLDAEGYRTGIVGKYMNSYTKLMPYVAKGWDTWNVVQEVYYYNYTLVDDGTILKYGDDPEDYQTDVLRERSLEFLRDGDGEPFFLYVGFPAPHTDVKWRYPLMPPRHEGTCEQLPAWRPPSYNEADISDKPEFLQYLRLMDAEQRNYIDKFRNDQICSLKATDEAIAAILNEVGEELDNTIVIFSSDNGFFWGEHRMEGKFNLYEEAIRIPLAIRYPLVIEPQIRNELVSNIDIAPTISEMTDSPPKPYMKVDGTSLTELFVIGDDYWRDKILIEQIRFGNQSGVRTSDFKYVESLQDDGKIEFELYDLRTDPYELNNVATNPGYSAIRTELAAALNDLRED